MQNLMPPVNTPDNLFHDGNEATGVKGTIMYADFMNDNQGAIRDIQQEIISVLADAGLTPDPTKENQLLLAIQAILGTGVTTGLEGVVKSINATFKPDPQGNVTLTAEDVDAVPFRGPLGTVDLHTLNGSNYGWYHQGFDSDATTARNYPVNRSGSLVIYQNMASSQQSCTMEYRPWNTNDVYRCNYGYNGTTWSGWAREFNSDNPPSTLPVGIPLPWPTDTPPPGYAIMAGQTFVAAQYPLLALAYPSAVLPDMRAQTIKGKPDGRAVLSAEADDVKSHTHGADVSATDLGSPTTTGFDYGAKTTEGFDYGSKLADTNGYHEHATKAIESNISLNGGGSNSRRFDVGVGYSNQQLLTGEGNHQHWVAIGAHGHNVYIGAHSHQIGLGSHTHGVTIHAAGNPENTVKNIAFNYIVRLA